MEPFHATNQCLTRLGVISWFVLQKKQEQQWAGCVAMAALCMTVPPPAWPLSLQRTSCHYWNDTIATADVEMLMFTTVDQTKENAIFMHLFHLKLYDDQKKQRVQPFQPFLENPVQQKACWQTTVWPDPDALSPWTTHHYRLFSKLISPPDPSDYPLPSFLLSRSTHDKSKWSHPLRTAEPQKALTGNGQLSTAMPSVTHFSSLILAVCVLNVKQIGLYETLLVMRSLKPRSKC